MDPNFEKEPTDLKPIAREVSNFLGDFNSNHPWQNPVTNINNPVTSYDDVTLPMLSDSARKNALIAKDKLDKNPHEIKITFFLRSDLLENYMKLSDSLRHKLNQFLGEQSTKNDGVEFELRLPDKVAEDTVNLKTAAQWVLIIKSK